MMKFSIDDSVSELFPGLTIGVLSGSIGMARPSLEASIAELRAEALDRFHAFALDTANMTANPNIAAWRQAYQRFGAKAKTYKPTHEALARRLLKEGVWPNINPIVDIYLTNQVAHLLPHGGYDANAITGVVRLSVSEGGEKFDPLGGGEEFTSPREVVYRDDVRILTRRWNYRDCDAAKITRATEKFIMFIESPSEEIPEESVEDASRDLAERYGRCFEGEFRYSLVRASTGAHDFEF